MAGSSMRLIEGVRPTTEIEFIFDGRVVTGFEGESIVSALLRRGLNSQRRTLRLGDARGYYCGMGLCWECAVLVEGEGIVRSCSYPLRPGVVARTADGAPA